MTPPRMTWLTGAGNKKAAALALVILVISACTTATHQTSYVSPKPAPSPATKAVQILSDPSGARIEVNDNYVGDTPITVQIPVMNLAGQFGGGFTRPTTIRAIPVINGQYVQTKFFTSFSEIPNRMLFEMNLGPASAQ